MNAVPQVYGLAMYVEQRGAMAEVARLKSQGFFKDGDTSVDRMCSAIGAMNVTKARFPLFHYFACRACNCITSNLSAEHMPRLAATLMVQRK